MNKPVIMIVDDDPNIAQLVRLYLEKDGYSTVTCSRGDEALEQFRQNPPGLMILDLMQGTVDGVLITDLVAKTYMALNPGKLAISECPIDYDKAGGCGVAVAKGDNEALLAEVNAYIAQIHADGTFDSWIDTAVAQNATLVQVEE